MSKTVELPVYEVMVVLKPLAETEDGGINRFETALKDLGGTILKHDKLGRRRLAHLMQKNRDGIYSNVYFTLLPSQLVEFRRQCKLNEDILRVTLLRRDDLTPENIEQKLAPAATTAPASYANNSNHAQHQHQAHTPNYPAATAEEVV